MDIATFRQNFTEFSDTTRYPESLVAFWLDVVTRLLRSDRWADLLDVGLGLALALGIVLARCACALVIARRHEHVRRVRVQRRHGR